MAEGENVPRWPGPVTFDDDDPKKGFACVKLKIEELKLKKGNGLFAKKIPANASVVPNFANGVIQVTVKLDGKQEVFEYKKNAPAAIDESHCELLYEKDKYVYVKLAKSNKEESWARHSRYFITPP